MGQYNRAKGRCDRCGFTFFHDELRKEWTGLLVCKFDYDPPPKEKQPLRLRPEGLPVRDPRPDD